MNTGANAAVRRRTTLRSLYRGLFAVGLACLGYCLFVLADAGLYGAVQERRLERAQGERPGPSGRSPLARPTMTRPSAGELIGRIEVPRLGLRAIVAEGVDRRTLRRAVGHLPGTALPGGAGNVGLAGHRDTLFRSLQDVRAGDLVRLVTPDGWYEYVVESTSVVEPTRTEVLEPAGHASLTLITCYPFSVVGPAPGRFVVRARFQGGLSAGARS
jgi:sortase A